jgi:HSP20 family protein
MTIFRRTLPIAFVRYRTSTRMSAAFRAPAPPTSRWCAWTPPTDVVETATGGFVRVEIAGMDADDFQLSYADGNLTIGGNRRQSLAGAFQGCHQKEIATGEFWYQVAVPWRADPDSIHAEYRDGFLTVSLPRKPSS